MGNIDSAVARVGSEVAPAEAGIGLVADREVEGESQQDGSKMTRVVGWLCLRRTKSCSLRHTVVPSLRAKDVRLGSQEYRLRRCKEAAKTWFYVNTNTQPPSSSWSHPSGPVPPPPGPPPSQYQPPSSQPPNRSWPSQSQYCPSQGQWGAPQQQTWGPSPSGPGYGQPQGGWNSGDRDNDRERKSGGLLGLLKGSGGSNHGSSYGGYGPSPGYGGGYGQPQGGYGQQPVYVQQQQQPKKSGLGGGAGLALGAGAGLLGGVLLADAVGDVYDDGYDAGFDNGGGGDDYGDF